MGTWQSVGPVLCDMGPEGAHMVHARIPRRLRSSQQQLPAHTPSRAQLFVGRTAQLGFAASLIGETLTGKGPLAQFDFETGESLRVGGWWMVGP